MTMNPERGVHQATTYPGGRVGVAEPRRAPPLETPKTRKKEGFLPQALDSWLVRLGLAGTLLAGAIGVARAMDNNSQQTEISRSFDPTLNKGTIGPSNAMFVTQEELKNYPLFDADGNPYLVLTIPQSKETEYVKQLRGIAPAGKENIKNVLIQTGIPAGETITASNSGFMYFNMGTIVDQVGKSTPVVQGFKIIFINPEGNWDIRDTYVGNRSGGISVEALVSAPDWIEASVSRTSAITNLADLAAKGVVVQRGDSILSTLQEVDVTYMAVAISADNKSLGDGSYRQIVPLTTSSNSTTEQKLVAVK